jgi:DNA-binding SARP family transcriptional activator
MMEFRILGPLEVVDHGRRLTVAAGRERALLALLVLHANRVVSTDRVLDEIWAEEAPGSGAKAVTFHIARLRDSLCPGRRMGDPCEVLRTERGGYVLQVGPDDVDAVRFERLAAEGRALLATDPAAARARCLDALALWRGEPLADVAYESFAQPEIRRLVELRLQVLEDRIEADLALGRSEDLIGELQGLVVADPLRERLRGQLMLALYRAGRRAEALRTYEAGRRLLSEELGIEPSDELEQLHGWILRQDPHLGSLVGAGPPRNPYKGLRAFGEQDRVDFHGREALVARLVGRLAEVARAGRLLVVVGPSGSGKSSVVRAGLIPALRDGALQGSEGWPIGVMFPGTGPFRELAAALQGATGRTLPGSGDHLGQAGDLATVVDEILPAGCPWLVLVIDQFEELFSLVDDPSRRARFLSILGDALAAEDGRLLVVATLRADAFDQPLRSPRFGELVRAGVEVVTPLDPDELERAIVHPARAVGVELEPGLASEIIADVARQSGELPLLQYALTELFERSDGGRLTRERYAAIGGVLGALGRRAEETYLALDRDGRETARQVFLRLVSPGDGARASARRATRAELEALSDDGSRVEEVVDRFARRRLLSFDRDPVGGEPMVEVAHEALLVRWTRLAGWVEEARDDLRVQRRLADAAAEWERAGRAPDFLLNGGRLEDMAAWADATMLRLDASERELLAASLTERGRTREAEAARVDHERRLERRAATRLRALVAVLAVALLVVTSLSLAVYRQGESEREQGAIARARELAAASIAGLGSDTDLSLLLAVRAAGATASHGYIVEEAMYALHWALQQAHVAYPPGTTAVAVMTGPGGRRGVPLLPPATLIRLAMDAAGRTLSAEECRTYLHDPVCPPPSTPPESDLEVYTVAGTVPTAALATMSLEGSRVEVVSQLPVDLAPLLGALEDRTGISVGVAAGTASDLAARSASGDVPDVAIVSSPGLVDELAADHHLVDMSGFVDLAAYRSRVGAYLAGLGTANTDRGEPGAAAGLYGAVVAAEVSSLLWYPAAAFGRAGYAVPRTLSQLAELGRSIRQADRTPWCLGVDPGSAGAPAADIVEDLVLLAGGTGTYDDWVSGRIPFRSAEIRQAFARFAELLAEDGAILEADALESIPERLAALPMLLDPPLCWMHPGASSERLAWSHRQAGALAATPFPTLGGTSTDLVRGRVYEIIVFRDRPEVRQLVRYLLGDDLAATAAPAFAPAGLWTLRPADEAVGLDAVGALERGMFERSLRAGTFRIDASDLMPTATADAFARLMLTYIRWGPSYLEQVLRDIDATRPGGAP